MLTGTVMPIADRIKKLKAGMQAHTYNETGSNPKEVTRTIVEKDGQKKGEFVKVGKEVVESSATQDVKTAGTDLCGECIDTNPTVIAGSMDDDNVVQDKDDVQKEESIKKSAAPMAFSFGSTLQKVEKFRKSNSLNKADVQNIVDLKNGYADNPHGPWRGDVKNQRAKEKALGITQRLRNHMKGKLAVIQGSKQDAKPELKPGLSQQEIAAANNQKVDVSKYKKEKPFHSKLPVISNDNPMPSSVPPPQLKAIQGGVQPEQKKTRLSPEQIKAQVEAAKQRRNTKTIENKAPAKQQQSHLKIV
jgi:hypothetical protein